MNSGYYYLMAVGLVFVAFNFTVNGFELFLPSTFGYAMIVIAANALRDDDGLFGYGVPLAAVLAVLAFPDLFSGAVGPSSTLRIWEKWTYYPYSLLHMMLCVLLALAVMRRAGRRSYQALRLAACLAALLTVTVECFRYTSLLTLWTFYAAFVIYVLLIAWLYLAGAKRLA